MTGIIIAAIIAAGFVLGSMSVSGAIVRHSRLIHKSTELLTHEVGLHMETIKNLGQGNSEAMLRTMRSGQISPGNLQGLSQNEIKDLIACFRDMAISYGKMAGRDRVEVEKSLPPA